MPIEFECHEKHNLCIARWSGRVENSEFLKAYRDFHGMSAWRPGLNHVSDARGANVTTITADAMRAQNALTDEMNQGLSYRVAVLVDSEVAFGLSRMYELLNEQSTGEVKVCRDQQEACAWVGCPIELLDRS